MDDITSANKKQPFINTRCSEQKQLLLTSCKWANRGEELRLWQRQDRTERLYLLIAPLVDLTRRLLMAHMDWDIQEQVHLDHATLEVRARPEAEILLITCRWAEGLAWQSKKAVEILVTREFSVTPTTNFCATAVPEFLESIFDPSCEFSPVLPEALMDQIIYAIEHDVLTQTHTA